MNLKNVKTKIVYDNSKDDIEKDLFIPLMNETKYYYRGVGFFSSKWIQIALEGINSIINNKGKMFLITSPNLSKADYEAICKGDLAKRDEVIYKAIIEELNTSNPGVLTLLSWLIADGILEIKFAICKNKYGMYHDKLAIFEDESNNTVCVHGSINDSLKATYNGEGVSVFNNWSNGQEYCVYHKNRFLELWNLKNSFYYVIEMPEKLKEYFVDNTFSEKRPYDFEDEDNHKETLDVKDARGYQLKAIESLKNNDWKGIFEMATGTGKTFTSLLAMKEYKEEKKRQFLIIVVPYKHLVEQWKKEIEKFGWHNIIKCKENKNNWKDNFISKIKDYNSKLISEVCIICTYYTASSDSFINWIEKIKDNVCLIADECHYIGSKQYSKLMISKIDSRLGLSATPERWFDEEGTKKIDTYFGKIVYRYSLEKAIENNYLTPYNYYPVLVRLNDIEQEEYNRLTTRINKWWQISQNNKEEKSEEYVKALIRKRKTIISKAINKYDKLIELLKDKQGDASHILIYCAKGENKVVTKLVYELGMRVHDFVYEVGDRDRQDILKKFDSGEYQVLVAIKCLDEGVDVPSTKTAYFLSSTTNPREFVQRRGRILRKDNFKSIAEIYDFIVFPNDETVEDMNVGQNIIKKELPRFAEFSMHANNQFEARRKIFDEIKKYNLEPRMNLSPWEIYKRNKEEDKNYEEDEY